MTASPAPAALDLRVDELGELTRPVLLVALAGLFDAGSVATATLDEIAGAPGAIVVGAIDPDPFYDFTVERPAIAAANGQLRVQWPSNEIQLVRTAVRDLVVLNGVEPHVLWGTYVDCVMAVIERLGVELVVTLGAERRAIPHTLPPFVVGSSADRTLARTYGLAAPSYQGPTGLIGVLLTRLAAAGIASASLRVGVPNYLPEGEHPRSVAALVANTAHLLGVPLAVDLEESIRLWEQAHDRWLAEADEKIQLYARAVERKHRDVIESAAGQDDLASRFEELLRGDEDPGPDDG